jgi:DNA-binding NarL/FixJ family response regulator
MTRIVLADDHRVVLEGLRLLLGSVEGLDVVGEAKDGYEAIDLVEELSPDILVMDLMMPNLGGLEATRLIEERFPGVRIIILSMHDNNAYIMRAFKFGAEGYVLKDASSEELVTAIETVMRGEQYLSPIFAERIYRSVDVDSKAGIDLFQSLTPREREVFQMVAEGDSSSVIAEKLSISSRTVETHRSNFMRKLGIRTQTDLVRVAIRQGVISLEK